MEYNSGLLTTSGGSTTSTHGGHRSWVASNNFYFNLNTDSRKKWQINPFGFSGGWDVSGAWNGFVNVTLRLQPSDRLQASVSTNYTQAHDVAQWIKNEDLDGDGTDEHVYGRLRRNVVNITGRATYAFSTKMTLEAYMQPFVAVGDYSDIRKLARARSFDFEPVTISGDPDFNKKSLRGTIVMRWEYLPGSTLFLVWNMSNADATRPGVFSPLRDLGSGFAADGTDVFVAKADLLVDALGQSSVGGLQSASQSSVPVPSLSSVEPVVMADDC